MREGNITVDVALLSKIPFNYTKSKVKYTKFKVGVKSRQKRLNWDKTFLLKALTVMRSSFIYLDTIAWPVTCYLQLLTTYVLM